MRRTSTSLEKRPRRAACSRCDRRELILWSPRCSVASGPVLPSVVAHEHAAIPQHSKQFLL